MLKPHENDMPQYYVPQTSIAPIWGIFALFFLGLGSVFTLNKFTGGVAILSIGFLLLSIMCGHWIYLMIHEFNSGLSKNIKVDLSFRMGMGWFLYTEFMFFGALFAALFYVRYYVTRELSSPQQMAQVWSALDEQFRGVWPYLGTHTETGDFAPMHAMGLPAINTLLLLSSGVTLTIAHHAILDNHRKILLISLMTTILLGLVFSGLQAYEYIHAVHYSHLTLSSGIYGSLFYMMTGFHGLHVLLGVVMLSVIWGRCYYEHFTTESHFAFEAVAWYWHFVDVIWLLLFVCIYYL